MMMIMAAAVRHAGSMNPYKMNGLGLSLTGRQLLYQ